MVYLRSAAKHINLYEEDKMNLVDIQKQINKITDTKKLVTLVEQAKDQIYIKHLQEMWAEEGYTKPVKHGSGVVGLAKLGLNIIIWFDGHHDSLLSADLITEYIANYEAFQTSALTNDQLKKEYWRLTQLKHIELYGEDHNITFTDKEMINVWKSLVVYEVFPHQKDLYMCDYVFMIGGKKYNGKFTAGNNY